MNRVRAKSEEVRIQGTVQADLEPPVLTSLEDRVRFLFRFFSRSVRRYGYKLASKDWGFLKALLKCSKKNRFFDYVKGCLVSLAQSFIRRLNGIYYWLRAVNPCNFRGWLERSVWLEEAPQRPSLTSRAWSIPDRVWRRFCKEAWELVGRKRRGDEVSVAVDWDALDHTENGWHYKIRGVLTRGCRTVKTSAWIGVTVP